MSQTKSYFDNHTHHHAYVKDHHFYDSVLNLVVSVKTGDKIKILDVGCGNGSFIKGILMTGIEGVFVGTDVSPSMLNMAKEELSKYDQVQLFAADAFNLPLESTTKFDLIHIDSVLHHLIGNTRSKSMGLVKMLLDVLTERLSKNGILIIEEMFYLSYLFPHITSSIIFYGLKWLNSLHLDISRIRSEFQPGLEVNFMSAKEIETLIEPYGTADLIKKYSWEKVPKLYRLFFLKGAGHVSYIVRRSSPP